MKFLSAPWRWNFISNSTGMEKCIFCESIKLPDKESLICYRGKKYFIILNKYPYNTGHLMIAPNEHLESPDKIAPESTVEMWRLMNLSLKILKEQFNPHGFNLGMNIGKSAGAGVKEHFHLHIVPRWEGDSSFMATIGKTKLLSYDIENIYNILHKEFNK